MSQTTISYANIAQGIKQFTLLQGLIYDPNPLVWGKWLADESDLKLALHSLADAVNRTAPMLNKRKYVGVDFDPVRQLRSDMLTYLTSGRTDDETAALRKRNLPMFYLVIVPILEQLARLSHSELLLATPNIISHTELLLDTEYQYGNLAQAYQVQRQIQDTIRQQDELRQQDIANRQRRRKSKDPMQALLMALGGDADFDSE